VTPKAGARFATLVRPIPGGIGMAAVLLTLAAFPALAQPFAYVTNSGGNYVSVINTITNTGITTVPVGINPLGVAINPKGTRAYVANTVDFTVSVIDTASNTVVATVPVGNFPVGIAVTPDGTRVYVANDSSNTVSVIDTTANTVVATVSVGTHPYLLAITPDGTRAYVSNLSSATVSVINTATNTVVTTVPVGNEPEGVAFTPDGTRAWVTNANDGTVSVINTTTNTVVATVPVGTHPGGVAITPDGTRAYVSNFGSANVFVIDTATDTVVATVPAGSNPHGVAFLPDGTRAYVVNFISDTLSVIATSANTVAATVLTPPGSAPFGIAITPALPNALQVGYAANLTHGDSFVNITDDGDSDPAAGNLCVNVYGFDSNQELLSCCTCRLTPNEVASLSVNQSLLSNTLTGVKPPSAVITLVATSNTGPACQASNLSLAALAPGMHAWGTTLHALPAGGFGVTETEFAPGTPTLTDLHQLASFCAFIAGNGSGQGVCGGCSAGAN